MYISVSKILCAGSIDSMGNYNYVIIEGVCSTLYYVMRKAGEPAYGVTFIVSVCYDWPGE